MRRRPSKRTRGWTVVAVALLVLLWAPMVHADARLEARRHFKAGMAHIAAGRYRAGIAELEQADAILAHPAVRYNVARAWAEAGEYDKAIASYQEYLRSEPLDRAEVEKRIATLRGDRDRKERGLAVSPKPPAKPVQAKRRELYQERVVTASRRAQRPLDSPSSTSIVTRQDIRLSGITRIPELLRRVAGVDVMQITGGDSNVSLRGLNSRLSNKLLVLVDGRSIKNDLLGSVLWESLPIGVDQIERIEVVRGPGSALYGADAFAGVVNIITVPPGEGGQGARAGMGDHQQFYGSLWTSGRKGDLAYRSSVGFTRYPRWTRELGAGRVDIQQADVDQNIGVQNARADARVSRRFGEHYELRLGGGYAHSLLDIYGVGPFNDYVLEADAADGEIEFVSPMFKARSNYTLLAAFASSNSAYLGHSLYETDPRQHSFQTDAEFSKSFALPDALRHALTVGASYRLKKIDWNYLIAQPPIESHFGVFAQDTVNFLERYAVVLSGRLDYVPVLEGVVPSVRGSVLLKPTDSGKQVVRLSAATAFRTPTVLESYLDLPVQLPLSGLELTSSSVRRDEPNFRLGPEKIFAAEVGYLNQESDLYRFELAVYYHRISDLIVLAEPRPLTLSGVAAGLGGINPQTGRFAIADGGWTNDCDVDHVIGGEVEARWYGVEGLDVYANYAFNHAAQQLRAGCETPQDQRTSAHKVNVGTQLRTDFGIDGELSFHFQSPQVWGEQVATLDGIIRRLYPLPAYQLVNGRVGYSFLEGRRGTASVAVFNALSGLFAPAPQMHPFGNRIGRRIMGFLSFRL